MPSNIVLISILEKKTFSCQESKQASIQFNLKIGQLWSQL